MSAVMPWQMPPPGGELPAFPQLGAPQLGAPPGLQGLPGLGGSPPTGLPPIPGMPPLPGLGTPGSASSRLPPGVPPLPGMPGGLPPGMDPSAAFAMMQGQGGADIASQMTRWAADAYDMARNVGIAPEIQELADHFAIDERATRALDQEMKKRKDSFDEDLKALWVGLEGARNPSGMLMLKIKDMVNGNFRGISTLLDDKVQEFAKRYRLDAQAAVKLAEVLDKRETPDEDMDKIGKHLERSNKPSALMMMLLKDLRDGKPVKDPEYAAAIGSRAHEKELDKTFREKNPWNKRSRSRRGRRSPSRRRQRDRSRERRRSRSGGGRRDRRSRSHRRDRGR